MSWRALKDLTWHEKSLLTNRHVCWLRDIVTSRTKHVAIPKSWYLRAAQCEAWSCTMAWRTWLSDAETIRNPETTCNDLQRLARQDTVLSEKKAKFSTFLAFFLNNNTYMICTCKIYKHTYCWKILSDLYLFTVLFRVFGFQASSIKRKEVTNRENRESAARPSSWRTLPSSCGLWSASTAPWLPWLCGRGTDGKHGLVWTQTKLSFSKVKGRWQHEVANYTYIYITNLTAFWSLAWFCFHSHSASASLQGDQYLHFLLEPCLGQCSMCSKTLRFFRQKSLEPFESRGNPMSWGQKCTALVHIAPP